MNEDSPGDTDFAESGVIAAGYKIMTRVITSVCKRKEDIDFNHLSCGMRDKTNQGGYKSIPSNYFSCEDLRQESFF